VKSSINSPVSITVNNFSQGANQYRSAPFLSKKCF
jgi:hypothetical protein